MTSVNVTTTKNTVTVNGETSVVTVKTAGPQGPAFSDGDKGDVTVSNNGTAISINNNAITSAKILDGTIVDADINASAAIALSKLATGALPTAITVTSANISDLSIVDADISSSAAISLSKLATGALPTAITVTSANISDLSIVNADVNGSAAIAGTKINPDFGSQNVVTTGTFGSGDITILDASPSLRFTENDANPDYKLIVNNGVFKIVDETNSNADRLVVNTDGHVDVTGNLDVGAGLDVTGDSNLDGKLTITQNGNTTPEIEFDGTGPNFIRFNDDSGGTSGMDLVFRSFPNTIGFETSDNNTPRFTVNHNGQASFSGNLDVGAGLDVTGDITVTGTVDNVDIATRDTLFGGLTSSSGVLTDGVTATTQSAGDNSTKIATTAYTDTAISNLVNSAPSTLDTLKELSDALGSDPNFATTVTNSIATKLPLAGGTLTGNLTISNTLPSLFLTDTNNNDDYSIQNQNGYFAIKDESDGFNRLVIHPDGTAVINGNLDVGTGIDVTGNITATGSLGIGTTSPTSKLSLSNDGPVAIDLLDTGHGNAATVLGVGNQGRDFSITAVEDIRLKPSGGEDGIKISNNGNVELFFDNSKKLETTSSGVNVTGNLGIGENSPDSILHIKSFNPDLHIENTGGGTGQLRVGHFTNGAFIGTYNDDGGGSDNVRLGTHSGDTRLLITSDGNIQIPTDNQRLQIGASQDFEFYHDSNNSIIANSTGSTFIKGMGGSGNTVWLQPKNNESSAKFNPDGDVELFYDNSLKFATTSTGIKVSTPGHNPDIKITGANGSGAEHRIFVAGSNSESLQITGNTRLFLNGDDINFRNAATTVDLFTITSNGDVNLPRDNKKLQLGASQDLQLYHDGSNSAIQNATGTLYLYGGSNNIRIRPENGDDSIVAKPNNSVELYFDNSKKLETTSGGIGVTGQVDLTRQNTASEGGEIAFRRANDNTKQWYIDVFGSDNNARLRFHSETVNTSGRTYAELTHDEFRVLEGTDLNVKSDSGKLLLGDSADLQIYHNGSNSFIDESSGTGKLIVRSSGFDIKTENSAETMATFNKDGAVELYHDNVKQIQTTANGVGFVNNCTFSDNKKIQMGNGNDLQLFHNGTHSNISNITGSLRYLSNTHFFTNPAVSEVQASFVENSKCELRFDNAIKLETTSSGATVTGNLTVDGTGSVEDVFKISDSSGGQRLLMGNRDSAGVDCPKIFAVGNASLTIGIGDSWSGDGGTLTNQFNIAKNGTITSYGNHDFGAGIDVTGAITGTADATINGLTVGKGANSVAGNTAFGLSALAAGVTGDLNVGVGRLALTNLTSGTRNVALGSETLDALTTGNDNVGVGYAALSSITTGSNNVGIGRQAGASATTASNNTGIGFFALLNNTTGTLNVAVGSNALDSNTTASQNTAIGHNSLQNNSTGEQNTGVGTNSLYSNNTGNYNVGIGKRALYTNTTGSQNTSVGTNALDNNSTADNNTAVGYSALGENSTGANNNAFGSNSLNSNTTGQHNVAIGTSSQQFNTTGEFNTTVGTSTLNSNSTGTSNVAVGHAALLLNTTASLNTAIGTSALRNNTTGASNTAVGSGSLDVNTTASNNTAVGKDSLGANTTGINNTSIGANALDANTTGQSNVAVGNGALGSNTTASNNTAVGKNALILNTIGTENTAIGTSCLTANTEGNANIAIGFQCLDANTTGGANTAVGRSALGSNTTASDNSAFGHFALLNNTTGSLNCAFGRDALVSNTTASNNTAVGKSALSANTTGAKNTAVGTESLKLNTTGEDNVAIGRRALTSNTTGVDNTAVGSNAFNNNDSGRRNTGLGYQVGFSNLSGDHNVAIGYQALRSNTTADNNIAIGFTALFANTTGTQNTAIASQALDSNTTGDKNIAIGQAALSSNTTGDNNVAVGINALDASTTANGNTAVGFETLTTNTTGGGNAAFGRQALQSNTTGANNTSSGVQALKTNTTGSNNTATGIFAMHFNTTGSLNTGIGRDALINNTTGGGNVGVGFNAGNNITTGDNNLVLGQQSTASSATVDNEITLGNSSNTSLRCNTQTISSLSDARDKTNVIDLPEGLDFVTKLRPVKFEWATRDGNGKDGSFEHGFIAQDLQATQKENDADYLNMVMDENPDRLEASYGKLVPILVKAIQELTIEVNKLKSNG